MACSVDGMDMCTISLSIVSPSLMVETMETLIHIAKGGNGGRFFLACINYSLFKIAIEDVKNLFYFYSRSQLLWNVSYL